MVDLAVHNHTGNEIEMASQAKVTGKSIKCNVHIGEGS